MTGTLKSINCTSCGAGLDVFGGGRVLSHACGYCGAVLDAQYNYKVLAKNEGLQRPESPLRLGDQGVIDGVNVTVIGTLGLQETYRGRTWRWAEHQVFSATHGYGWISIEDGHMIWTRKDRRQASPRWVSEYQVNSAEARPKIGFNRIVHKYYETTKAVITFIEGEFNFVPKLRGTSTAISFLGPDTMVTMVAANGEREIELSRRLPDETWNAFGTTMPRQTRVHPLQAFVPSPNRNFLAWVWGFGVIASLVLAVLIMGASGPTQRLGTFPMDALNTPLVFDVQDTTRPVRLELSTNLSNQWSWFEIEVADPTGQTLFETGRQVSYYHGVEGGESWSEGSRNASLGFQPTTQGPYTLSLNVPEGDSRNRDVTVMVTTGVTTARWSIFACLAFLLLLLFTFAGNKMHNMKRWSGSDWVDEDD